MKDLQRISMDHPKLKFGTTMDAIGVYSAEIDCIQFLNDAFDIMTRNRIPWLNALTYLTLWFPVFAERLFVPEVFEDDVVGPEGAAWSGVGPVGGLRPALDGLRHLLDPQ